jgi:hypothetical protein
MKICSIRISVLSIVFSLMFLIISTGTKTEAQGRPKNDLVSELRLELPGLLGPKSYSTDRKDLKVDPLRGLLLPLKEGLNAFIDGAPRTVYSGCAINLENQWKENWLSQRGLRNSTASSGGFC